MENFDLSKVTTYRASAVQASMNRTLQKVCDDILKPYGISPAQWMIIGITTESGKNGARVSDLAEQMGTTLSFLTTSLNLLESRKIIARTENTADSRSKLIVVVPAFKTRIPEIEHAMRVGLRKSIYMEIDPVEFRIYMKVLFKLNEINRNKPTAKTKKEVKV